MHQISGEANNVDTNVVENWMQNIPQIIENYSADEIWNLDESGLFYRAMPNRTIALNGAKCRGGKLAKERITVLLACSSNGEKYKLLVIGKSVHPRCFKGMKTSDLPAFYLSNRKSWMTSSILNDFMHEFNLFFQKRNRKVILLMDNAAVHNCVKLLKYSNITVKYLPLNTTAVTQPLDQGIIRAWKARFRSVLLRRLISRMDSAENVSNLLKEITVKHAIDFAVRAWNDLPESIIQNCFRKSGIWKPEGQCEDVEIIEDSIQEHQNALSNLMHQLKFSDSAESFINFDHDLETFQVFEPEEGAKTRRERMETDQFETDVESDEADAGEEDIVFVEAPIMTNTEASKALESLKDYAISKGLAEMLKHLNLAENYHQDYVVSVQKQCLITDFFSKL